MRLPSDESINQLIKRIALITDSMRAKGVLVLNLAPLPRYQGPCCVVQSHGLQGGDSPGTLNTLLRDVGVNMGSSGLLNQPDQLEVVISPLDVVGPSAFLHYHTSKDNVNPKMEFLAALTCAILFVRRKSQTLMLPGVRGLLPTGLPFSSFHLRELESQEPGNGALPDICFNPKTLRTVNISNTPLGDEYQFE